MTKLFGVNLSSILGVVAVLTGIYATFIYNSFASAPTLPSPDTGREIAFNFKSKTVFISLFELRQFQILIGVSFLLLAISIGLYQYQKRQ